MYKVIKREQIVPNIHLLIIESDILHKNAQAGEFVVVRADEKGERIPLNLVDWDPKSVSLVFMEVGTSTSKLAALEKGDKFKGIGLTWIVSGVSVKSVLLSNGKDHLVATKDELEKEIVFKRVYDD